MDIETNYHLTGGNFWGACALRKMLVKKEYRGKEYGIATLLLGEMIKFCKDKNVTNIYLGTVDKLKGGGVTVSFPVKYSKFPRYFPV